jgi:hypothetical protein
MGWLRRFILTFSVLLAIYVGAFMVRFDIFSSPVRNAHGWLGPLIHGDARSQDIGKVYDYGEGDTFYYQAFWPLCKLWLSVHGL